jgi:hypothetical protein
LFLKLPIGIGSTQGKADFDSLPKKLLQFQLLFLKLPIGIGSTQGKADFDPLLINNYTSNLFALKCDLLKKSPLIFSTGFTAEL